jgi:hypothetical protein
MDDLRHIIGYPERIDHFGLIFRRELKNDGLGNQVIKYHCETFPNLDAPEFGVTTLWPSERQLNSFIFAFHNAVANYTATYAATVESKLEQKRPMFFDRG